MPNIRQAEVEEIYRLSKLVSAGVLTESAAGNKLVADFGMNYSSAMGYLRKRKQLLSGIAYKWTMNSFATRYFLDAIFQDEQEDGLEMALRSVRGHIDYYNRKGKSGLPSIRAIADDFELRLRPSTLEQIQSDFSKRVAKSRKLKPSDRQRRLPPSGHLPEKQQATVTVYIRNQHVVAEALYRAAGICQDCRHPAPFKRKSDGSPFLEVHHIETLGSGGPDTIDNALALCPNCHRKRHFG